MHQRLVRRLFVELLDALHQGGESLARKDFSARKFKQLLCEAAESTLNTFTLALNLRLVVSEGSPRLPDLDAKSGLYFLHILIGEKDEGFEFRMALWNQDEHVSDRVIRQKLKPLPESSESILAPGFLAVPFHTGIRDRLVVLPVDFNRCFVVATFYGAEVGEHLPDGLGKVKAALVRARNPSIIGGDEL